MFGHSSVRYRYRWSETWIMSHSGMNIEPSLYCVNVNAARWIMIKPHVSVLSDGTCDGAFLPGPLHSNNKSPRLKTDMIYDLIRWTGHSSDTQPLLSVILRVVSLTLQSLCRLFPTVLCCIAVSITNIWTTRSPVFSLRDPVPFASFDWHFCDPVTGACTCSHHGNNPL